MTRIAQPAVVIALLMSDWRERHSRYSPTTQSVIDAEDGEHLLVDGLGGLLDQRVRPAPHGARVPRPLPQRVRGADTAVASMNSPLATVL